MTWRRGRGESGAGAVGGGQGRLDLRPNGGGNGCCGGRARVGELGDYRSAAAPVEDPGRWWRREARG